MDKKARALFLRSLTSSKGKRLSDTTGRAYLYSVRRFEKWLNNARGRKQKLDNANTEDISNFDGYLRKDTKPATRSLIFTGLSKYYEYRHCPKILEAIEEIRSKLPTPQPIPHTLSWDRFQKIVKEANLSDEKLTLLNLLWSEMKVKDIRGLWNSDIDFQNRCVKKKEYSITKDAWLALEKYVSKEDRGTRKELFKKCSDRKVQTITADHFGVVGQTPLGLRKCCKNDLIEVGRTIRFRYKEERKSSSETKQEQDEKLTTNRDLSFITLFQEIENFGEKMHTTIPKLENERQLQLLLESYLFGAFPKETIIDEYEFRDDIGKRCCDIVVGKDRKFGIEVKLAKENIIKLVRDGKRQINEFLSKHPRSKGIVVVGDKEDNLERREEYTQKKDRVCIIVI